MEIRLKVQRYNPEVENPAPYYQDFTVEVEEYSTVLDTLIKVREYEDDSLALRCSCRGAICGSCGMRVNGHATLACKTKVISVAPQGETITVEPMGNMPVIKDLVTDMKLHWDKVRQVEPWLQPQGPEPEAEYLASPEAMTHLNGVMSCIMCGVCVSDCTALEVDPNFIGPAALAKAYRFVADPRDDADVERLRVLNEYSGIWDCTRCMECVQVCPKGVAPMDRIMALRDMAMEAGFTNSYGARHAEAFTDSIRQSGWLDEMLLTIRTVGYFNVPKLLSFVPVGWRSLIHRKLPMTEPFHPSIPGMEKLRRIIDRVEGKR